MITVIEPAQTDRSMALRPRIPSETRHTSFVHEPLPTHRRHARAFEETREDSLRGSFRTRGLLKYVGPYSELSPSQRRAVTDLTVRRYIDEIYHLDSYLQEAEGLTPGSPEFQRAKQVRHREVWKALSAFDDRTYISALLFNHGTGKWTAVAAMRIIRGGNSTLPVSQTIGSADSTIPTHRLLRSFRYPRLPNFDPDTVLESNVFEASRLVCPDDTVHDHLVGSGEMSPAEFEGMRPGAFDEIMAAATRFVAMLAPTATWIFNVKPRLAAALRIREGFNLVPLFTDGVEPTELALSSPLDRPYFYHWSHELLSAAPPEVAVQGIMATVRHLAGSSLRTWQSCAATLPYLVVSDPAFLRAIQKIEARVSNRSYNLSPLPSHA